MKIKEIKLKARLLIDKRDDIPKEYLVVLDQIEPQDSAGLVTCIDLWDDFVEDNTTDTADRIVEITIRRCDE